MLDRKIYRQSILLACIAAAIVACDGPRSNDQKVLENPISADGHHRPSTSLRFNTFDKDVDVATFSVEKDAGGLRTYRHSSTQLQRDEMPQYRVYREQPNLPRIRTDNIAFDALFALAIDEMKGNAVSHIRDGAYNQGQAIPCNCFETGEKWNYVWTRDLAYAAHLSLGILDPLRVRNSLEFKTSAYREDIVKNGVAAGSRDGLQIIQDTGSGGSWPISTDRVSWAFGAEAALNNLVGAARISFAEKAFKALKNTIENDRLVAFDQDTGLYTGEQSFLDWREQSYAIWISNDLSKMATSSALSTNAAHFQAIRLAGRLAVEFGELASVEKYQGWAEALKSAINTRLWLPDSGMYSSLTASHFDQVAMHKYDWLGQTLAIITGIADKEKSRSILSNYPHGPMGAPVIFPQQPGVAVYHNRAIWPFVTAYGLKAAKLAGNMSVADSAYTTLIRGAALNISNMENFEWLSLRPQWTDIAEPDLAGPVVNSRRQLWSVAAYLNMVIENVFGVQLSADSLDISPLVTSNLRKAYFANSSIIELVDLEVLGKNITLKVALPKLADGDGVYDLHSVSLNGVVVGRQIPVSSLMENNTIHVQLGAVQAMAAEFTRIEAQPSVFDEVVFAPYAPRLLLVEGDAHAELDIVDTRNPLDSDIAYQIFRDGKLRATDLPLGKWRDPQPIGTQACYAAIAIFKKSGNQSHHSPVRCVKQGIEIPAFGQMIIANKAIAQRDKVGVIRDWGKTNDVFNVTSIQIDKPGNYALQVKYFNAQHDINTGITCGLKWMQVRDHNGRLVGEGAIQLPHTKVSPVPSPRYSTPLELSLPIGDYQLSLLDYFNMSYMANNQTYTAAGGVTGPINRFDIYAVRILPLAD